MSAESPSSPSLPAPRKPRSTVERSLVWGGILLLLIVVVLEYTAKSAQSTAVETLLEQIRQAETTPFDIPAEEIKAAHVKAAVGNMTPRVEHVGAKLLVNGGRRLEVYRWFSINPLKAREMYVYYGHGDDPYVISVSTEEETESIVTQYPQLLPEQIAAMRRAATADIPPADAENVVAAGESGPAEATGTKGGAAGAVQSLNP